MGTRYRFTGPALRMSAPNIVRPRCSTRIHDDAGDADVNRLALAAASRTRNLDDRLAAMNSLNAIWWRRHNTEEA